MSSGQSVRAVIQHAVATRYRSDDADVASFRLKFDVRLTNGSDKKVDIPTFGPDKADTTRIAVLGVQAKQPDGTWSYLVQSSWYDTGDIRYARCGQLSPERTEAITGVGCGLLILRKQLLDLGSEPTVRFNLLLFSRQPDGKVLTTSVTTDSLGLRLPAEQ